MSVDLGAVCLQALEELEGSYPHRLRFESRGNLRGEWDSDRLMQVMSNLAANALQYGPADGVVGVALYAERDDEVILRVNTGGPPIAESALRKFF